MKKIALTILIITFVITGKVFADSDPTIETLSASGIGYQSAVLNAEFNSRDNNYFPTDQPIVWFEYGTSKNNLNKETSKLAKIKGNYIVSQGITNLQEDTKYWYRSVLRFDSNVDYGESFSFITDIEQEEVIEVVNKTNTTNSNYLSPDELLQQYYDGTSGVQQNVDSIDEKEENQIVKPKEQLSFFEFIKRKLFGDDTDETEHDGSDDNLIYTEEEIKQIEKEEQERLDSLSEQKKHNNSAAHDDELGEIIEYNTNYQNKYKNTSYDTNYEQNSGGTLNYSLLLILIIFLIIATFLVRMLMKKRSFGSTRRNPTRTGQTSSQGRYYIPVNRNPQNPVRKNNTEFRNPKQK